MNTIATLLRVCVALAISAKVGLADDHGVEFFEQRIRPQLVEHCYKCHSARAENLKGNFRLDSRNGIRTGGPSGPAVVPGDADASLLVSAIEYTGQLHNMPPDGKLPDPVIADFRRWVEMGAPDPRDDGGEPLAQESWDESLDSRRNWWSLRPVTRPTVPMVENRDWSGHPVDRFILAELVRAGIAPAAAAKPQTLIRRLSLVLTGLPPSNDEVDSFLRQCDESANLAYLKSELSSNVPQTAIEALVDRLLASPRFGERWARHWMDVVRFTETHGNEWNYEVHHAWRYRDYLIRAFNQDVPFDQLVREHVAGDLLSAPRQDRDKQFNESVIGTAFFRFGEVNHDDCIGLRKIGYDLADNQLDTLTKAFQAATVACARCHDHKIDPVSMADYYGLLGILRSSRLVSHTIDNADVNQESIRCLRELKRAIRRELSEMWLRETRDVGRYLLAADAARRQHAESEALADGLDAKRLENWMAALKVEDPKMDYPLSPWMKLTDLAAGAHTPSDEADDTATPPSRPKKCVDTWRDVAQRYATESRARIEFNKQHFVDFADFRSGGLGDWYATGQGLRGGATGSGDFSIQGIGENCVPRIFPAGCFTHTVSPKLNGALRSPVVPLGKKHVSLLVMGQRGSALRLVSNNCQLNYANYHALITDELHWVKFSPPDDRDGLRTYAELMTMLDNPKFPDQLATLGGDTRNYREPWEAATADPRSWFGVTRAVLHDCDGTPKAELDFLLPLFGETATPPSDRRWSATTQDNAPAKQPDTLTSEAVAARYAHVIQNAVRRWSEDRANDADTRWLNWLVHRGLVSNTVEASPRLAALVAEYRGIEEHQLSVPRIVPGVGDFGAGIDQPVFARGDCLKPGDEVPRRYLEVLGATDEEALPTDGSGRLQLANRIASADNPLTARVLVNRLWHHLFGAGLVRTVDDFGRMGELPSHPALLDFLAARFVEDGWSVKRMIRWLVLTRTFATSARATPAAETADPLNRLLHHNPARRMEAESIRDSILAVSGRLDQSMYGLSVHPYREKAYEDRRLFPGPLDGNGRRSVYIKVNLMESPRFLSAFNLPGGKVTQGRRDVSNVPAQALAMMNDPFIWQQAEVWAGRLVARNDESVTKRLHHMFQAALGRRASHAEIDNIEQLVKELAQLRHVATSELLDDLSIWTDAAHLMFNQKEFVYIP